jgi:hypothetical protein
MGLGSAKASALYAGRYMPSSKTVKVGGIMNSYKICLLLLIIFSVSGAQQLEMSHDSLLLRPSPDYIISADTLVIWNSGQEILIIDSLISKNFYGYHLDAIGRDTTIYYYIFDGYENFFFKLLPSDSASFIIYDPDLCPICTPSQPAYNFQDSIYVYSNSIDKTRHILYTAGVGWTDIGSKPAVKLDFKLEQNFPNPFNSKTQINVVLSQTTHLNVSIYNAIGQKVEVIFSGELSSGNHKFFFDGSKYASGIYYYSLVAKDMKIFKKMVLLE